MTEKQLIYAVKAKFEAVTGLKVWNIHIDHKYIFDKNNVKDASLCVYYWLDEPDFDVEGFWQIYEFTNFTAFAYNIHESTQEQVYELLYESFENRLPYLEILTEKSQ
jgi:hypothetical protein